jgi:hypothetical protein
MKVTDTTRIDYGDGQCSWLELLLANDFADDEAAEIRAALEAHGEYVGGGGAAWEYRLTLADAARGGSG